MNKRDLMYYFLSKINNSKYMELFLKDIFNYNYIYKYNYISRCILDTNRVILDVYDNISNNRFNRYIFIFNENKEYNIEKKDNVFVHYIYIDNLEDSSNKLLKLGYMFKVDIDKIEDTAKGFLSEEIIKILKKGLNLYK